MRRPPKRVAPHSGQTSSLVACDEEDHLVHTPISPVTGEEYRRRDTCHDDDIEYSGGSLPRELENIFGCRHFGLRLERA